MVVKKEPQDSTKGGSPSANTKQEVLDKYNIKESPKSVYIIERPDDDPLIIKKPIGKELGSAHLEILLEMHGEEPLKEFDPSTGTERTLPSPRSAEKRKAAIKNWVEDILPKMLLYPKDPEELSYVDQFLLFSQIFAELETANNSFRLLR